MMNIKLIALAAAGLFLTVAPISHQIWAAENAFQTNKVAAAPKSDDQITQEIKDEINADKQFATDASKVNVKTDNGKVTLTGSVADQDTKADVESVAKDIAGDNNVTDNIVVNANA